jgi:hypothetical protein
MTGSWNSPKAVEGANFWVARFAGARTRAGADATTFEEHFARLEMEWRECPRSIRANSATDLFQEALPSARVVTVGSAATLIKRTFKRASQAIQR